MIRIFLADKRIFLFFQVTQLLFLTTIVTYYFDVEDEVLKQHKMKAIHIWLSFYFLMLFSPDVTEGACCTAANSCLCNFFGCRCADCWGCKVHGDAMCYYSSRNCANPVEAPEGAACCPSSERSGDRMLTSVRVEISY